MIPGYLCRRVLLCALLISAVLVSESCRTWTAREGRAAAAYNEGNSYRDAGRMQSALESYGRALKEEPDFKAATFNMAVILVETGRPEEGLSLLKDLESRDPENLRILRAAAWAAWEADRADESVFYYKAALDIFAGDEEALEGLALVLEHGEHYQQALEHRRFLYFLDESDEKGLQLASTLYAAGDSPAALGLYMKILAGNPGNSEALSGAADINEAEGRFRESLLLRLKAAESGSEDVAVEWWSISRLRLVEIGDYQGGLDALKTALSQGFDNQEALEALIKQSPPEIRPSLRTLISEPRTEASDS